MSNETAGSLFITKLNSPWWNISDEVIFFAEDEFVEENMEEVEVECKDDFKDEKFDLFQSEKEKTDESEKSEKSAVILKTLEEAREAKADLQEVLPVKKTAKSQHEEALKQLQEEKYCLERALKKEQAEKDSLNIKLNNLREQVADLKKSLKEYETSNGDLKTKVNHLMANLDQDKTTISRLHGDLELSSVQHETEKALLTLENQQLSSEKQTLQDERGSLLQEKQLAQKQLEEEKEARTGLEKAVKKEKSQLCEVCQKLQAEEKELSEKTLSRERSPTTEKMLRSSSKAEKQNRERSGLQKQAPPGLRRTSKSKEDLIYDMQTLKMENANLRAKLEDMESQYNRIKSVFKQHQDKTEGVVDELKAWSSKGQNREKEPEMALKGKKTRTSELQQRVGAVKKQHAELKDASTKRVETPEEQQTLAEAAQKNQDSYSRFPEQKMEDIQLRQVSDTEHKIALDQSTKALYNLQKEYIDLVKKNSDLNDDYRELLKTHTALQIKNKLENLRSNETT